MNHTFINTSIPEEVLEHYGVPKKSGRYPWGSGENPYHHGASSPFGRLKKRHQEKAIAKKRKAAAAKAKETKAANKAKQESAEEYERRKQWAIEKGTATDIAPFVKDMSKDEFRKARERLEEQEKFMKLVVKETPAAQRKAKIERFTNNMNTVTQAANASIAGYNAFARVHNAFSLKEWPVIPSSGRTRSEIKSGKKKDAANTAITNFNEVANKKRKK